MDNIYLCGTMGSGKTTIGKILAEKLKVSFLDLDQFINVEKSATVFDRECFDR